MRAICSMAMRKRVQVQQIYWRYVVFFQKNMKEEERGGILMRMSGTSFGSRTFFSRDPASEKTMIAP
jgi:hypothetical protein